MSGPPVPRGGGYAEERTRLSAHRTALTALALAGVLIKVSSTRHDTLDGVAGSLAALVAALAFVGSRCAGALPRRAVAATSTLLAAMICLHLLRLI